MDIVVLVSGRGSNLRAIASAIDENRCAARIVGVVSDRPLAAALEFAEQRGIPSVAVPLRKGDDRLEWNRSLAREVAALQPTLVVLAGFMRILGHPFLSEFGGRTINVHPSLLPAFPGKDGPAQALAAKVRITGCTVHLVDEGVDTGTILAQAAVPVSPDDDEAALHARIQRVEHRLLPQVIDWIARGTLRLDDTKTVPPIATTSVLVAPSLP